MQIRLSRVALLFLSFCLVWLMSAPAFAQTPVDTPVTLPGNPSYIFDSLPTPLVLPPGNVETLPLNHQGSFFGDAFRVVDCSNINDAQFGTCGNQFFGGVAMMDSHLSGNVTIQFFPIGPTTAHFVVTQGTMRGDDTVLAAPMGYSVPVTLNSVADSLILSSGDVDLISGYANPDTLQWNSSFANSAYLSLLNVNPNLTAPIISFPGVRGHAWANFVQRPDGLLDFYFRGSTFLPLGNDTNGQLVRFPLPFCNPNYECTSMVSRGLSLHPHLYLNTASSLGYTPCAPSCPDLPTNKVEEFTDNPRYTAFGDDFDLLIPELGGQGPGRSELEGRLEVQFGTPTEGTLPFVIQAMVPEGLFAEPPADPLLGPNFRGFLLGPDNQLHFPLQTYNQHKIVFANEIYNFAQGLIDLNSGQIIGQFEFPLYIGQELIDALFGDNNGRVSTDPFFAIGMPLPQNPTDPLFAFFEKEPNGQTMFRANLFHHRSFATFCYPMPSYLPGQCWVAPDGANLNIFVKLQAAHLPDPANPGNAVLSSNFTYVSGTGDTDTVTYSIPCNPVGQPVSFVYTNNNSGTQGGTFTMQHVASVSCVNSKVSTAPAGSYDSVQVTGFGTWSKDPAGATPRFVTASLSVDPANPYAFVIVFQKYPGEVQVQLGDNLDVILSSGENKPPTKPAP